MSVTQEIYATITAAISTSDNVHVRERLAAARQCVDDAGCILGGYEEPHENGWAGEHCGRCRRRNVMGFTVTDAVWAAVTRGRWTILCPTCFDEEAQLHRVAYSFVAVFSVTWSTWFQRKGDS